MSLTFLPVPAFEEPESREFCESCKSTFTPQDPCRCDACEDCGGDLRLDEGCQCVCVCQEPPAYQGSWHFDGDPEGSVRSVYACRCGFHEQISIYFYGPDAMGPECNSNSAEERRGVIYVA